jgi:hypothetical protein
LFFRAQAFEEAAALIGIAHGADDVNAEAQAETMRDRDVEAVTHVDLVGYETDALVGEHHVVGG